jgi:hypothetical protein
MPAILRSRLKQRGSIFIMFTLMLMTVIIPMAGLAIDLTLMYVVQAKLWEAVDGAALEAGRLIGVQYAPIQTLAVQACTANFPNGYWAASTPTGAAAICDPANITYNLPSAANGFTSSVQVTAKASVPLLFMKVFQLSNAVVAATGTASRRSVRVEVLVDRSASMASPLNTVLSDAAAFVTRFNAGYDELGYVTFGTTAVVGYPLYQGGYQTTYKAGNWDFNPNNGSTGYSGPDNGFNSANAANAGGTKCCDMISSINQTVLGEDTNTAEALSVAYIELQKAHIRDANDNGGIDPIQNNVIVLFTDGVPTTFSAYVNSPDAAGTAMSPDVPHYPVPYATTGIYFTPSSGTTAVTQPGNTLLKNPAARQPVTVGTSGCVNNPSIGNPGQGANTTSAVSNATVGANPMIGALLAQAAPTTMSSPMGLLMLATTDGTAGGGTGTASWSYHWLGTDSTTGYYTGGTYPPPSGIYNGCNIIGNGLNLYTNTHYNNGKVDLYSVPKWDMYGNSTSPIPGTNGYTDSTNTDFVNSIKSVSDTGYIYGTGSASATTMGQQIAIAAWNAADNAGWNIRSDNATMKVIIYTIGYSGDSGGCDDGLLAHIANDPATNTSYANTDEFALAFAKGQRQGRHFPAGDTNAVADAFNTIAGMLLGLTR